jgi:hypothetical protein
LQAAVVVVHTADTDTCTEVEVEPEPVVAVGEEQRLAAVVVAVAASFGQPGAIVPMLPSLLAVVLVLRRARQLEQGLVHMDSGPHKRL